MARGSVRQLYYITHVDKVPSILEHGILSHQRVETAHVQYTPTYDDRIVANRRQRQAPDGRSLWSFANLYFQPRNAMLYRVVFFERNADEIAIVAVRGDILDRRDVLISEGNAAGPSSAMLDKTEGLKAISCMRDVLNQQWWREDDGSKRKMMAECLVPDRVPPELIEALYVASHAGADRVKALLPRSRLDVIPEPQMFFQQSIKAELTGNPSC